MRLITFNIGYIGHGNSGILSYHPFLWHDCDIKTFAKKLRQKGNIQKLFKWAKDSYVTPSSIALFVTIIEDDTEWTYTIKMINVREYRAHWEKVYKKEWKDVSRL